MVIGAFPAAKLASLLVKQISKPIANYIKYQAKSSPVFRTYICMPPAQFYNWCEVKTKMWILNLGKPVNIPVLNEAMAIELGANLLGEAIIFIIGGAIVISEYNRSARKDAAKEQAKEDEMNAFNIELQEIFFEMEEQRVQIKELQRKILDMESLLINNHIGDSKKDKSSDDPPSPPTPEVLPYSRKARKERPENVIVPDNNLIPLNYTNNEPGSLLAKAIHIVENDFWINPDTTREIGILTIALNHLYKDVYKLPDHVLIC